jgi:integrase
VRVPFARPMIYVQGSINYEHYARLHLMPTLGKISLARLTPQHVQRLYADKLASGKAPTSVNHMAGVLHHALNDAVRVNLIPRNVTELVDPPRVSEREMLVYPPDQARVFLQAAQGHRLEALFTLWITTGMRQGESLALKWADTDLAGGHLQVKQGRSRVVEGFVDANPKTKRGRRKIVLTPLAIAALHEHRKRQLEERMRVADMWQESGYVFTTPLGAPLDASGARKAYYRLIKQAGLQRIRPHDLRHSAATLLLLQGVPVKVVSEMLGHASVAITMDLYSHVLPDMQRDAAAAMQSLLRRQSN